jgi:hypothetical protein
MIYTPSKFNTSNLDIEPGFHQVQAIATALDGFTVREDFMAAIRNYIRKKMVFWPLLRKERADGDLIREILEGPEPQTGFFAKTAIDPIETPSDFPAHDLTDPGEYVKAGGGLIHISHYSRSLYQQQQRPYGDIIATKTKNLIVSCLKTLEEALFLGDATADPLSFNGMVHQTDPTHLFTADITTGDSVVRKIRALVRLAVSDKVVMRNITHIFTNALGLELIENEMDNRLEYVNVDQITPGLRVPGIITQGDTQGRPTPIFTSPYIDSGATFVDYYLVDMDSMSWKGVIPEGGTDTFDPQIFEVSKFTGNATPYLVEKRMCLFYGTLYATKAGGSSIYRLRVTVPAGMTTGI